MATDLERGRELIKERFSKRLWRAGWTKNGGCFRKQQNTLEFDDIGFFWWLTDLRVAGMAWDSLDGYLMDGKIKFKNDVVLEL